MTAVAPRAGSVSSRLRLRAHAKINLALRVGPLGDDGYHPLATVLQTISLCDLLYARRAPDAAHAPGTGDGVAGVAVGDAVGSDASVPVHLRVEGAELPRDNTVVRAVGLLAVAVRDHGTEPPPLELTLIKRIPPGTGLGGGSSDAVAALAACVRLWRLRGPLADPSGALADIAAEVGSDVPFFLSGGTAMGTGRGVRIEPLEPLPATWLVIAAPDARVSTARAYQQFDRWSPIAAAEGGDPLAPPSVPPLPPYQPRWDTGWMGNDLAEPVCSLYPEVERVRRMLAQEGARVAQMTGSGAASFGAFADRRDAARAARRLRDAGCWARACVSIDAQRHLDALFGARAGEEQAPTRRL